MGAIDCSIDHLLLDSENPRNKNTANQRDALQKVLDDQEEKLFVLAEDIVEAGLSPMDRMLVLRENNDSKRFMVLEGNRRVAALKILSNPSVLTSLHIKPSLQKRFEALSRRFVREEIEPIACFEVTDREEGNRWILLRHTGENEGRGVVGWSGLAAARFRGGDPALQALEFVRNYGNLSDNQKHLLIHSFPITTLERLLSTREVRKLIGVEILDKKLSTELPADEAIKPLKRMVLDLVEKKFNVSKLKNKAAQTEYIQNFESADRPDFSKKGVSIPIENIREGDFKQKPGKARQTKRRATDPSDRKTVIPARLRLNIQDPKVAAIFKELKGLRAEEFRNACAVLFRVFLELSVDAYMETNQMHRKFKDRGGQFRDKTLQTKVEEVINHLVEKKDCDRKGFRSVSRGLSVPSSPFSIELLHDYVHNRFVTPQPQSLIEAWNDAQPFFEQVWA
ncbi:MAG: hypothetical protein E8D41_12650 [Nitrospira sp.]|nr:MAG: hypothetical protein E8D41_12650 [Nitrospira sp.]